MLRKGHLMFRYSEDNGVTLPFQFLYFDEKLCHDHAIPNSSRASSDGIFTVKSAWEYTILSSSNPYACMCHHKIFHVWPKCSKEVDTLWGPQKVQEEGYVVNVGLHNESTIGMHSTTCQVGKRVTN